MPLCEYLVFLRYHIRRHTFWARWACTFMWINFIATLGHVVVGNPVLLQIWTTVATILLYMDWRDEMKKLQKLQKLRTDLRHAARSYATVARSENLPV